MEKVHVEFSVPQGRRDEFLKRLQEWDVKNEGMDVGFRADDYVSRRAALVAFVDQMEIKLRKNEYKKNWREKPIEALIALMLLELQEFQVALKHFAVSEARAELPDLSNFGMMIWDRMQSYDQDRNLYEQQAEIDRMRAQQGVKL